MQHDGWLETYLHSRFPKHDLVDPQPRLLGRRADAPAPLGQLRHPRPVADQRPRPTSSSPSSATTSRSPAQEGLAEFKTDLDSFVKHTLGQQVQRQDGPAAGPVLADRPREPARAATCPTAPRNNERLELYTAAMAEVAKANGVAFVDLFQPTRRRCTSKAARSRSTINGVHLNEQGNRAARRGSSTGPLRRATAPARDPQALEKLRQAVLDKNFYWFNRYRTVDGYSIYGGRADLKFVGGQTNRVVAQREMEVLDVMTANRDRRIWAVAQGERPQGRRQQHAAVHPGRDEQARRRARTASTSSSSGEEAIAQDDGRQGPEGQPVRLGEGVPRAGQAGADGVRRQGPALGRRLADLSALEAQGGDERQAPDPRRHRRRRQGRQEDRLRRRPALPDRLRVLQRRRAASPRRPT